MVSWLTIRRPSVTRAIISPANFRWILFLGLALGIWLSSALYLDTLSLPFFEDDPGHIRWLSHFSSPFTPFITAAGIPAYRPLGEMLLKLWYLILGRHDAAWLRFLNISMHSLNVALVAALAWRLDAGRWRYVTAGIAATLFGVLPFAYQAIPWINVFFYPLNNLLQLLMVLVYWEARVRRSNSLLVVALFLCALSPFEIEYGLMSSGLLLGVEIVLLLHRRQKALWLGGPLLGLLLNVGFLLIWLLVPKSAYEFGPPTPERVMQISAYLLQGITYPAAPLALALKTQFGLNDLLSIALVGLLVMLLVVAVLAYRRQWPILIMSLLWFFLLNLPGLITLTFDYVINSPRLLYPSGPALAWLWAGFFTALVELPRTRVSRFIMAGAAGLAMLIIVGMNVDFVRTRMEHYHIAEDPIHQLGAIAAGAATDDKLLVVNMPSWVTPSERTFALGNNGIQLIPFYISIEDFVYAANDRDHPVKAIQFHNIRQEQPYYYGLHGQRVSWEELRENLSQAGDVYLTQYEPENIELTLAGQVTGVDWEDVTKEAEVLTFENRFDLVLDGYQIDGESLQLDLAWHIRQATPEDLTVFVHLYGPDGQLMNQDDGYPLRGLSPFWLWDSGQVLRDRRTLTFPTGSPAGTYAVAVGLYDPGSGQRLSAKDSDGNPLPDDAAILLQIGRP